MLDYVNFRKMITPMIIKVLFWIGAIGLVIGGIGLYAESYRMSMQLGGAAVAVLGPFLWRIMCEILIVVFQINDNLQRIQDQNSAVETS